MHFLAIGFRPLRLSKSWLSAKTTASDLLFYDIFAPQKVPFLKISDDVIACDLRFGPPPIKNPGYAYGGHNIMLNWMTEITDLLQFFVVSVKFGSDYVSRGREVVLSF